MSRAPGVIAAAAALALGAAPARADDPGWELRAPAAIDVAPGAPAAVSLTIAPLGRRTVSRDGPVTVALSSPTLELRRARYERRHAADPAADAPRFELGLVAPAPGDHVLAIDVRFWLCGPRVCRPVHARREVAVRAAPPAEGE